MQCLLHYFTGNCLLFHFFSKQCREQRVSLPNIFLIIQSWLPKTFHYAVFQQPMDKIYAVLKLFEHRWKFIVTSAVTKDVYISPCILLIRRQKQYIRFKSGLFTSTLVVGRAAFLILIGDREDFMFRNDKLPSLRHSYNVFEYFLNKDSG